MADLDPATRFADAKDYDQNGHRKTLDDAVIFLPASKHRCAIFTRNISEFDQLMQFDARGRAVFYEPL
jgi:hypothetical protein